MQEEKERSILTFGAHVINIGFHKYVIT